MLRTIPPSVNGEIINQYVVVDEAILGVNRFKDIFRAIRNVAGDQQDGMIMVNVSSTAAIFTQR